MDVAFLADARRVAEAFGHAFDGGNDVLFHLRLCVGFFDFAQGDGGEDRSGPGAKIFGGEIAA